MIRFSLMPGPAKTRILVWYVIPVFIIMSVAAGSGLVWESRTILRLQDNSPPFPGKMDNCSVVSTI